MLDGVVALLALIVLPVLINKSTEAHLGFVKSHLRSMWTGTAALFSVYYLMKSSYFVGVAVQLHQRWRAHPWLGYLLAAFVGASLLCIYWWLAGRLFPIGQDVPPELFSTVSSAKYPKGTIIGGIPWSSRFSDLRVSVYNNGALDWTEIEVSFRPDQPVVAAGQTTTVPDVFSSAAAGTDESFQMELIKDGRRTAVPLVLVASTCGYRVQCKRLSRKQRLEIVFAVAGLPEYRQGPPPKPRADFGVFERDYAIRLQQKETGFSNWYGHGSDKNGRIEDVYLSDAPIPSTVQVEGRYFVAGQEKSFSELVTVHDVIKEALPKIQGQIKAGASEM
jgi:hypothetical protein